MSAEAAIFERLSAATAVVAIVGGRIVPQAVFVQDPRSTLPAIVYFTVGNDRSYTLRQQCSLVETRVQVDCIGRTYKESKDLANAVRLILSGCRTSAIRGCFLENELDDFEPSPTLPEHRSFTVHQDYTVHHIEDVAAAIN